MHNLKIIALTLAVVFAGFFGPSSQAAALEVDGLRFGKHGNAIRTVLDLGAEADFMAMAQDEPPRITLDLPALSGNPRVARSDLPDIIKDIRLEPLPGGYSRLTYLLARPATIRSAFLIPAANGKPVRLVVDIAPSTQADMSKAAGKTYGTLRPDPSGSTVAAGDEAKTAAGNAAQTDDARDIPFASPGGTKLAPISKPAKPTVKTVDEPVAPESLPLVVIDAGHGGIDPGAVGGSVREKDVTLAIAKALRTALESTGRYRVRLTRDRDTFIRLEERVQIARRAGADLFVSIHADSLPGGGEGAAGASFYTLSDKASDQQTARLAARENQADLLAGIDLPSDDKDVTTILIDLTMRETTLESRRFAGSLIRAFEEDDVPTLPGPHRYAGFMVLKAPDIPSVLIEVGFLSHPREVRKLADPAYRARIGGTIADGIDAWFKTRARR